MGWQIRCADSRIANLRLGHHLIDVEFDSASNQFLLAINLDRGVVCDPSPKLAGWMERPTMDR